MECLSNLISELKSHIPLAFPLQCLNCNYFEKYLEFNIIFLSVIYITLSLQIYKLKAKLFCLFSFNDLTVNSYFFCFSQFKISIHVYSFVITYSKKIPLIEPIAKMMKTWTRCIQQLMLS